MPRPSTNDLWIAQDILIDASLDDADEEDIAQKEPLGRVIAWLDEEIKKNAL